MTRAGTHVTFPLRKTYPEIEISKKGSSAILNGSTLHGPMKLNHKELK